LVGDPFGKRTVGRQRKDKYNVIEEWVETKRNGLMNDFVSTAAYGVCGTHGRGEKRVQGLGGKARRKEPLETPRRRWEDGIKMDFREICWGGGVMWGGFTWLRIGTVGGLL
jgi:hypothetical protein